MSEKTAIIYARVSTKSQADDELPIEGQLEHDRRKAKELGAVVLREFVDQGFSGRTDRRDDFREAVTYCRLRQVDYFICWSTSRFFRDHIEAPKYKRDLERDGTKVVYASVDFDRTTNEGWLTETIYEVFDELYSRQVSVDTMRGMIKNAKDGFFNGGRVPFGYTVVPAGQRKRLELCDPEAAIVIEIFELYLRGYGTKGLALMLNDRGITKRGQRWNKNSISSLLKNEVYAGRVVFNRRDGKTRRPKPRTDWIVADSHTPIVSGELFDQVQATFEKRAPMNVGGAPRSNFAFTGMLACGRCGSSLQTESAQGRSATYHYYNCRSAQKGAGCRHRRIPAAELDSLLIDFMMTKIFNRESVESVIVELHQEAGHWVKERAKRRDAVVHQLSGVETKLANLYGVLELHGIDAPNLGDLAERLRHLKTQRTQLETTLMSIEDEPPPEVVVTEDDIDQLVGLFQSIVTKCDDGKRQREFFSTFIDTIVVGDANVSIKYRPEMVVNRVESDAVHSGVIWLPELGSNQRQTD